MSQNADASLETTLTKLGFAGFEVQCLLYLARVQKASTKRIGREANITYNLAKVMLESLVDRGLVKLANTPDQDTYEFAGKSTLKKYLEHEKTTITQTYDAALQALNDFLG